jgi:hypothetical protein
MTVLQPHHTTFPFCDTDLGNLSTISDDCASVGLDLDAVRVVQGDGIGTLTGLLASAGPLKMSNTFAHLDPYQPFAANAKGITTVDVFCEMSRRGSKAMLWSGRMLLPISLAPSRCLRSHYPPSRAGEVCGASSRNQAQKCFTLMMRDTREMEARMRMSVSLFEQETGWS